MSEDEQTPISNPGSISLETQPEVDVGPKRLKVEERFIDLNTKDLINIMKCHRCLKIPFGRVYSCTGGHNSCNKCINAMNLCRTCYEDTTRNTGFEEIIQSANFHCEYLPCPNVMQGKDMKHHLKMCDFRPVRCHCTEIHECYGTEIDINQFEDHLAKYHEFISHTVVPSSEQEIIEGVTNSFSNIIGEVSITSIIHHYDGHSFLTNFDVDDEKKYQYTWISILGVESEAKKYRYSVLISEIVPTGSENTKRTIQITNIPVHSHQYDLKEILKLEDCFKIGLNTLRKFGHAEDEGEHFSCRLGFNFTISQIEGTGKGNISGKLAMEVVKRE